MAILKPMVTGDEKLIVYNVKRRPWSTRGYPQTAKASLHPKKVMLGIWWDWEGIVCYELLPETRPLSRRKAVDN